MPLTLNGTTGVQDNSGAFVAGTAVATTSGTSVDITGIPSWVKRVTVVFNEISTNGISAPMLQIGDSGGVETTGYLGSTSTSSGGVTTSFAFTTGFGLAGTNGVAGNFFSGSVTITGFSTSTNTWMCSGVIGFSNVAATSYLGSSKTLSATLDRVRITTVGGTDTFDSGSINILYE